MKNVISITEARKRLPGIIKSLKISPDSVFRITVHDEVVAEIRSPQKVNPGEAADKLLQLRKKSRLPGKKYEEPISDNVKEHLYVAEDDD